MTIQEINNKHLQLNKLEVIQTIIFTHIHCSNLKITTLFN